LCEYAVVGGGGEARHGLNVQLFSGPLYFWPCGGSPVGEEYSISGTWRRIYLRGRMERPRLLFLAIAGGVHLPCVKVALDPHQGSISVFYGEDAPVSGPCAWSALWGGGASGNYLHLQEGVHLPCMGVAGEHCLEASAGGDDDNLRMKGGVRGL
jgi:hypothetical protein